MENDGILLEQDTFDGQESLIIREAVKASSNLLASEDVLISNKITGALSILAIASNIKDKRHSYRLLNIARNLLSRSVNIK